MHKMVYDSIIIGNGPAGISASLYIKRANLSCLVLGKDEGSLGKTNLVDNYYGFEYPINGKDLIQNGIKQAKRLGVEYRQEEVIGIGYEDTFEVKTRDNVYQGRTVLLATGSSRNTPNIKGLKEFEGKGVSYCAICDAFFYTGKKVAVLGNGNYALNEAKELIPVVDSVTMLTNGKELVQNRDITVEEVRKEIREVRGDRKIEEIAFTDNTSMKIDGLFVAEGTASSTDLARKLGAITDGKNIVINEKMMTNIPGLYAAGDCTGGLLQICKAVYEGAQAGLSIINQIRN